MKKSKFIRMDEVFTIHKGKRLTKADMVEGTLNYIGAISENNGVRQKIDAVKMFDGNCITVNYNGSVGETFYQDKPFWASDDVNILKLKNHKLNEPLALYLITVIKANQYRFSYGRKWTLEKMRETEIMIPTDENNEPDWRYMEEYITSLRSKHIVSDILKDTFLLDIDSWKEYKIEQIFQISRGKTLSLENKAIFTGTIPCINGSSESNGVLCFLSSTIENEGFVLQKSPALSLSRVGNAGVAFLQNEDFYIADNAFSLKLRTKYESKYVYLFLSSVLNQEIFRFSYGRTVSSRKYMQQYIKLPTTPESCPDWSYMEKYIKSLPYSDRI